MNITAADDNGVKLLQVSISQNKVLTAQAGMEPAGPEGASPLAPQIAVASLLLLVITLLLLFLKPKSSIKDTKVEPLRRASTVPEDISRPSVRILYGTQTGTAERFSKQLGNELRRKYGDGTFVEVIDIENYKAERRLPHERLVLFLMATYGDGEPTDNAADFYSWICNEAEDVENGVKDRYLEVRTVCCEAAAAAIGQVQPAMSMQKFSTKPKRKRPLTW